MCFGSVFLNAVRFFVYFSIFRSPSHPGLLTKPGVAYYRYYFLTPEIFFLWQMHYYYYTPS